MICLINDGGMVVNKILYETSYIGNTKCFFNHLFDIIWLVCIYIAGIYTIKKKRLKEEHNSQYVLCIIVMFTIGLSELLNVSNLVSKYSEIVLGYKGGRYWEVEGIVEDYTDYKNNDTFTVNGVDFEISSVFYTWEYTYRPNENVITGDGQHLKIRYIPGSSGSNRIVYIEEIADE